MGRVIRNQRKGRGSIFSQLPSIDVFIDITDIEFHVEPNEELQSC